MKISQGEICWNCFICGDGQIEKLLSARNYVLNLIDSQGYKSLTEHELRNLESELAKLLKCYQRFRKKYRSCLGLRFPV